MNIYSKQILFIMESYIVNQYQGYMEQTEKHRNVIKSVLKYLDIETTIYESSVAKGVFCDEKGNLYKVSMRESDHPNFYLDSTLFSRMKRSPEKAMYIVVSDGDAFLFDINKYNYVVEKQFVNKNTYNKSSKIVKSVRVFEKWQRNNIISNLDLKFQNQYIEKKKDSPVGLFQNINN